MVETPSMIDESWDQARPRAVKRAGVEIVSLYLSPSGGGKVATPERVKAYHDDGVGVELNFEWYATRALEGAAAGAADAATAVAQIRALEKALGYSPKSKLVVPFSVDFDAQPSQYPAIDAYLRSAAEVMHAAGFGAGVYGSYSVVEHESAAGVTDNEWQTYAWSGGRLSSAADLYQYLNGQTLGGAAVDFDRIVHAGSTGAWWPPGSPQDVATDPNVTNGDADMTLSQQQLDSIAEAVWSYPLTVDGRRGRRADYALGHAWDNATKGAAQVAQVAAAVDGVKTLLSDSKAGVLTRVASLQAAVETVAAAVAKIPTSPAAIAADTGAIADAVVARVKSLVWKVAG